MIYFAVVFAAFVVAVWVPAGVCIWMMDKKLKTRRRLWQAAAVIGAVSFWLIFEKIINLPKYQTVDLWRMSFYLIVFGWSPYLLSIGLLLGFIAKPEDLVLKTRS